MLTNFPRKRTDNTFSVDVVLEADMPAESLDAELAPWLREWSTRNKEWTRIWEGQDVTTETLSFDRAFASPPRIVDAKGNRIVIRLDATASATEQFWKDWLVRLVEEISGAFPSVRLKSVTSAN